MFGFASDYATYVFLSCVFCLLGCGAPSFKARKAHPVFSTDATGREGETRCATSLHPFLVFPPPCVALPGFFHNGEAHAFHAAMRNRR
jgi:hypothetical protein